MNPPLSTLSSSETAFSHPSDDLAKIKDLTNYNTTNESQFGSGPTLKDPNDPIQNSDEAYDRHLEKHADAVGDGPTTRRPSNNSPRYAHFEHASEARSPTQSPSSSPQKNHLSTFPSNHSNGSNKTKRELERHNTLSTIRTHIGLAPEPPILDEHDGLQHLTWVAFRHILREPLAEFFGTFVMILFGNGSVAQVLLSTGQTTAPGGNGFGAYQSISWGWGIGVMLGIYVAGDSGGFLNPAVTFCFCLFRKLPWRRFPIYVVAQLLGGFLASGVVYGNYINAINTLEGNGIRTVPPSTTATAGIFCTYPQAFLTKASQVMSEFIASTILMFVIFALKDDSNPGAMGKTGAGPFFPLALFFLIFGLGACFGWETGYAINLARDFGPRLMSYIVGYGHEVWSAGGYYFWIPMFIPFCGCTFGALLYDAFLYTGPESPMNMPWFGMRALMHKLRGGRRKEGRFEV